MLGSFSKIICMPAFSGMEFNSAMSAVYMPLSFSEDLL